MVFLELQSLKNLNGKPSDETLGHSLEVVVFDEFVKVNTQALEGNHQVFSEQKVVFHANDIVLVVLIVII